MNILQYSIFDQFHEITAFTSLRSAIADNNNSAELPDTADCMSEENHATMKQVHGDGCRITDSACHNGECDALLTRKQGIFLRVVTADCLPLMFYDPVSQSIGVVHAGWKGQQQRIISKTIDLAERSLNLKASNLYVAVGPFIQQAQYEVSEDVATHFQPSDLLEKDGGKFLLNLGSAAKRELLEKGVKESNIEISKHCTFKKSKQLHSYRRDGKGAGRQENFIAIVETYGDK